MAHFVRIASCGSLTAADDVRKAPQPRARRGRLVRMGYGEALRSIGESAGLCASLAFGALGLRWRWFPQEAALRESEIKRPQHICSPGLFPGLDAHLERSVGVVDVSDVHRIDRLQVRPHDLGYGFADAPDERKSVRSGSVEERMESASNWFSDEGLWG
jgi:hypothetical protein